MRFLKTGEVLFRKKPRMLGSWVVINLEPHVTWPPTFIISHNAMGLTHWGWVTHIWISELGHHWYRWKVITWGLIVNCTLGNKQQWNLNQNMKTYCQDDEFGNADCEMMSILFRPPWASFTNMFYLNLAWISNHMPGKVWDEIMYPFLNFNDCTIEV